jgi:hypothetical protein
MLRIVPHTVLRVDRSYEHFSDGFELHLLQKDGEVEWGKAFAEPDQPVAAGVACTDGRRGGCDSSGERHCDATAPLGTKQTGQNLFILTPESGPG